MEKTFCCESLYDDGECNWNTAYDYCNNQGVLDSIPASEDPLDYVLPTQYFSCGDHESVTSEGNKIIYLKI